MPLKRLEDIQDGDVTEFIQIYANGEPKIFCKRFGEKDPFEESYAFLKEILDELKIPYEFISQESRIPRLFREDNSYSYEGIGRVAKDKGVIKIWNFPGYSYNKKHLIKYREKFPKMRFEKNI